jgi:hypothetical protein
MIFTIVVPFRCQRACLGKFGMSKGELHLRQLVMCWRVMSTVLVQGRMEEREHTVPGVGLPGFGL